MHTRLSLYILMMLFSGVSLANQQQSIIDQPLKQRLVEALATQDNGVDRFDAEVWLVDMTQRIKKRLKKQTNNEERLLNLLQKVHQEANRAELSPELVLAVIQVESNFDRYAISEAGARGLMQIMPFWLKELGRPDDNLFELNTNLRFGCTILRYYLDMEKGNITRALARYNGSRGSFRYPNKVFKALRQTWYKQ
ncbi:MAG: transglycosylase SLT domain-containing protein [Pseudomonadota bacterium]